MATNCSRHYKPIQFMCLSEACEEKTAALCEDCLGGHRHGSQEMAQVGPILSYFSNTNPDLINFIRTARDNFNSNFENYRNQLIRALDAELRIVQRRIDEHFANLDVYNVLPNSQRKTLFSLRVGAYERISPAQFRDFHKEFKSNSIKKQSSSSAAEMETQLIAEVKLLFESLNKSVADLFIDRNILKFDPAAGEGVGSLGSRFKEYLACEAQILGKALDSRKEEHQIKRLMKEASALEKEGRPKQAIEKYNQVLEINPRYYKAHNNKGVNLKSLGKIEDAIKAFQKSVAVNPSWVAGYINAGNCYRHVGKYPEAVRQYDKAIEIDPAHLNARYNKAICFVSQQKFTEAKEEVCKAKEIDPKDEDLLILEGICYAGMGSLEEAIRCYDRLIERSSRCDQAYYNRGVAYQRLYRYREAEESFLRAIEISPKDQGYKDKLQLVRRELQQH